MQRELPRSIHIGGCPALAGKAGNALSRRAASQPRRGRHRRSNSRGCREQPKFPTRRRGVCVMCVCVRVLCVLCVCTLPCRARHPRAARPCRLPTFPAHSRPGLPREPPVGGGPLTPGGGAGARLGGPGGDSGGHGSRRGADGLTARPDGAGREARCPQPGGTRRQR